MALKLIGAVGVKVRPEAEDFRDEAERQIKKQLQNKDGVPMDVSPQVDKARLRREVDRARKAMAAELSRSSKPVQFTTDIRFDSKGWQKARDHLAFTERSIRKEMEETGKKLADLDMQRKDSLRLARELALEHKKIAARAMRGTASGNDVARIKGQYELVKESLRQTLKQIDQLKSKQQDFNKDMVTWAKNSRDYEGNLQAAIRAHEELIKKTAEAHREYMARVRRDSENLLGGLQYGIRKSIKGIRDSFQSINGRQVLGLTIDTEAFSERLRRVKSMFRRETEGMDDTEVDIKPVLDESAQRIAWVRLKMLTRDRIAMIHVQVNKASANAARQVMRSIYNMSGARGGVDFLKDLGRYVRDIDKHVPSLAAVGIAATSAVGGVIALAGTISHLAVELAQMSGVALALPGIFAGFAVGIGAMIAVMRDFNKEVPQIQKDLGNLRKEMSSNFWKEARVPILDAWNKMFPHFSKGIQQTSTELGKWTGAMAKAFATHLDMAAFDKMFGNLNKSIRIASLSADDVAKSVSILGKTGSEYLPRLALWANEVADGFRNWLEEAERTGKLNHIIETGIQRVKEFGKLVRETGEFLYIFGSAAERAGFSGLKEMADGMERFNEALKSTEGRKALDDIMAGAAGVADGFKRAIGAVGDFAMETSDTLRYLGEEVGDMVGDTFEGFFDAFKDPAFTDGLRSFVDGVSVGLKGLTDNAPAIASIAGAIGKLAGAVAGNLGEVIGEIFSALEKPIADNVDDLAGAVDSLGDGLTSVIDAAGELGLLSAALEALAGAAKIAGGSLQVLGDGMTVFAAAAEGDIEKSGNAARDLIQDLINKDIPVWSKGIAFMANMAANAALTILAIKTGFEDFWSGIGDSLSRFGDFLGDTFENVKATIRRKWGEFTDWLSSLFGGGDTDTVAPGAGGDGMVTSLFDRFNFEGLGDELGRRLDLAKTWIQDKWANFKGWLGGLFGGGEGGGPVQIAIDFVMNAIDNASAVIQHVISVGEGFASKVWTALLQARETASRVIQLVKTKAQNFAQGFYQAVMRARDAASGLIQTVKSKAQSFAAGFYQAVLRARDSASRLIGAVRSKVDAFGRMARSATLSAVDRASSVISRVRSLLAGLKSKTINIVTNMVTRIKKLADGGVLGKHGIQTFADGGIRTESHVAQIAPAGAMRLWAEPETGGEAYIPLSPAKRTRSEQILATVADKFGMRLERYANGSNPTANRAVSSGGDTYNLTVEAVPTNNVEETTSEIMFNLKHMKRGGSLALA